MQTNNNNLYERENGSRKRIFVFRMHSKALVDVVCGLSTSGVEVVYWGGSKRYFNEISKDTKKFPYTVFHNTLDAVRGIPAPSVDTSSHAPPPEEFLLSMSECKMAAIFMMNSIDQTGSPYIQRESVYHQYVTYWWNVFGSFKPNAVLFGDIPHLAYHYVIYHIAKKMGIRTIMYRAMQIRGRLLFLNTIESYDRLERFYAEAKRKKISQQDLSDDVRKQYEKYINPAADVAPFYIKKDFVKKYALGNYGLPTIGTVVKNVKTRSFLKTVRSYFLMLVRKRRIPDINGLHTYGFMLMAKEKRWKLQKKVFEREYKKLQEEPDLEKKFLYVPLQVQPECSTSAMGGVFADQALMVEMLSASVPDDWIIYVKENPLQWVAPKAHTGRYRGYYRRLARLKNVVLIPAEISNYELIERSHAVAVVTGTPGWEAFMRGKPALVFGSIWYMYCDGVFRVKNKASCEAAFEKIAAGYRPDAQKILQFVYAVDKASIVGFPNTRFKKGVGLAISEEENTRNIVSEFVRELKSF